MLKFWLYTYDGNVTVVRARNARAAVRWMKQAVALVRDHSGETVTPDLWAI